MPRRVSRERSGKVDLFCPSFPGRDRSKINGVSRHTRVKS